MIHRRKTAFLGGRAEMHPVWVPTGASSTLRRQLRRFMKGKSCPLAIGRDEVARAGRGTESKTRTWHANPHAGARPCKRRIDFLQGSLPFADAGVLGGHASSFLGSSWFHRSSPWPRRARSPSPHVKTAPGSEGDVPVGRPSGRTHDARWPAKASTFFGSDWFAVAQPATPSTGQSHGLGMHDAGCNTQHIVIDQKQNSLHIGHCPLALNSLFSSVYMCRGRWRMQRRTERPEG